jgi:hypothetical protein
MMFDVYVLLTCSLTSFVIMQHINVYDFSVYVLKYNMSESLV